MSRLEVDVKSIRRLIKSRASKAQKTITKFEGRAEKFVRELVKQGLKSRKEGRKQVERLVKDVRKTVNGSPLLKNLKHSGLYSTARLAQKELEKRVAETQEKVFHILNVPTRDELDRLNKKVTLLTRKLNEKKKKTSRRKKK